MTVPSHYCPTCLAFHGESPLTADEALVSRDEAREDMAHYLRWLRVWSTLTALAGVALIAAAWFDYTVMIILFGIFTVAGGVGTSNWWDDDSKIRRRVRESERQYRLACDATVRETPAPGTE